MADRATSGSRAADRVCITSVYWAVLLRRVFPSCTTPRISKPVSPQRLTFMVGVRWFVPAAWVVCGSVLHCCSRVGLAPRPQSERQIQTLELSQHRYHFSVFVIASKPISKIKAAEARGRQTRTRSGLAVRHVPCCFVLYLGLFFGHCYECGGVCCKPLQDVGFLLHCKSSAGTPQQCQLLPASLFTAGI